ncbi:MAG: ATP-binding cassette domain-containing protein [Symploca sp. SIO2D2]|nr:ATP-binding cassette domain-containing protein [Symploca sp. SIO2D2]
MLKYFSKVWYILKGSRRSLPWLLLLFVISSVLEALGIGLIGPFLSLAQKPERINQIPLLDWFYLQLGLHSSSQFVPILGLVIAIVFCTKSVLYFISEQNIFRFSLRQKGKLISKLLGVYLSVSYVFYLRKNTASMIKNTIVETDNFTWQCMLPILKAIANLTVVFVLVLLLARTDLLLFIMIATVLLPTFLLFYQFKKQFKKWGKEISQSNQEIIRILNHGLGSIKDTRVIGCEYYFHNQMEQQVKKFANAATLAKSFQKLPRIIIETCLILFLVLFISIYQIFFEQNLQDLISILAVFAVAAMRLIPAASISIQAMGQMQNASYSVDMLYLDLKEIEQQEFTKHLDLEHSSTIGNNSPSSVNPTLTFTNQVELRNVVYRYPGTSEAALDNISLTIQKGQSIAFIGKSGAGKTTLVDVILGLLEPESGDILVDDVSIYKDIRSWQNLIGYIPQSIFLMDETIERNIAFGVPDHLIDAERMNQAIKAAQLTELVEQLPNGIKTSVGERGIRLSGGQRQRIGIARVLYHEREILVLDEATSALDNETEKLVSEAIQSLSGTKTMIIIAHRLTTVEHCDCIYLLEQGRLVKSGTYQEVVG